MAVVTGHRQLMADAGHIISMRNTAGPYVAAPLPVLEVGIWRTPIFLTPFGISEIVPYDADTGVLLLGFLIST